MGIVNRVFKLRPGEARTVVVLGLLLLSNSLALEIAEVVSVSGFLSQVEVPHILIVWFVDMLLIILTAGLQSLIVDRFKRVDLMCWMSFAIGMVYFVLQALFLVGVPGWFNYSFLFLLADQQWLFFPLIFWILANDMFGVAEAKRLFPLIAAFGFIGQILGLGIAAAAPTVLSGMGLESHNLLLLNGILYMVTFVLAMAALRGADVRETVRKHETLRETLSEGWGFVREVPSFRYLMLIMVAVSLVITILDFHFLRLSDTSYGQGPVGFQTFYSLYRLGLTLLSIIVQSFLTSRIFNKVGLKNAFFFLPASILVSAGVMLGLPGLITATGGIALSRLTQETIDESARKAFQALVPEERRGRVSMFMDSYMFAIGTIIGCLITGTIVFVVGHFVDTATESFIYLTVASLVSLFAIWAVFRLRAVYDSSLFNWRLKRRQRRGLTGVMGKLDFGTDGDD
jgi:AAA family ATP:ADP antiporter